MKGSHGYRSKTRHKLKKSVRERGTLPATRFIKKFSVGDRVHVAIEPAVHKGAPHPRFHGKTGVVVGMRGKAYLVEISDGNAKKLVISAPVHLNLQKV